MKKAFFHVGNSQKNERLTQAAIIEDAWNEKWSKFAINFLFHVAYHRALILMEDAEWKLFSMNQVLWICANFWLQALPCEEAITII